ncbi:hypothetical protein CEXT_504001 [Caerostris extrusa]|uniref:Uncharacterized protein n=1 Tax=Caerostris extrusa TaxID=172846 RepID=A0AAV4XNU3_CAEEX|nr:hypothetical protein CEXT_504001 [Caerostris extrusa]
MKCHCFAIERERNRESVPRHSNNKHHSKQIFDAASLLFSFRCGETDINIVPNRRNRPTGLSDSNTTRLLRWLVVCWGIVTRLSHDSRLLNEAICRSRLTT